MRLKVALAALVLSLGLTGDSFAQRVAILRDVRVVQVDPTVVSKPEKVKEDFAVNLVQDALRNALRYSNFEIGDAPIKAHILLEEFSSGSTAKRLLVGFGSGRSTVKARLIFTDAGGKEIVNAKLDVKGNLLFSGYQGANTQRNQATSNFDRKLIEEIARLK